MRKTMSMLLFAFLLLATLSPLISRVGSADSSDVEIVSAETGRIFFGSWWPISKFAKSSMNPVVDSFVEVKAVLVNKVDVPVDVQLSASFFDALNQALGSVMKNVTVPAGQTLEVFMDPFKLPAWAYVSPPQGFVEVVASPFYGSKIAYFDILGPSLYVVGAKTSTVTGIELTGVNLWMDNLAAQPSPVAWQNVLRGIHVVKAADQFVNSLWNGTFQYWNDHVANNPIAIDVSGNLTITAYYQADYVGPLPMCAMKTRTDGYFYVPIMPTGRFKIEMLFDNSNVTGDQNGGVSPYGSIRFWPDGKVDMRDISLATAKFGVLEGQTKWEYMADIFADRKVDMRDIAIPISNFGKTGTYITDLTGVTVKFNTGEEVSPDINGFVTIPANATSFTVNRNGTAIGSMITFW